MTLRILRLTRQPFRRIFAWATVLMVVGMLSLAGCGRKGDPIPPVDKREPVKEQGNIQDHGGDRLRLKG